jgi:tetratricopeptide (TPR) repeat protein
MKKLILVILTISAMSLTSSVWAQGKYGADSAKCITNLSFYKEYFKQKNYEEALPSWRNAYKFCPPTANQTMLIDGTTLLRQLITKNSKDVKYREALIDSLLTLHKTRAQYYPANAVTAYNNMGQDLHNYVRNDAKKLYEGFESIIANNQEKTRPTTLLYDMQAAVDLFSANGLDAETVINLYQRNSDLLEKATPANDTEKEQVANVKNDMGSLFASSKVASCESLVELYTPRLAADPDNLQLAQNIVKTMSMTEGCDNNDLFLQAVTTMNKLDPSPSSSYYLYRLHGARGNVKEAIVYMENALASEDVEDSRKADWTYELATFCFKNGETARAFEYASKVAAENESLAGKAYFLIGNIWGSTRCGGDEIARRAPYWVACDYMNKAKAADPSLADEANRYISQYSVYFPETAEAFMYDITKGQSYTVVCGGMRATTTVRTR